MKALEWKPTENLATKHTTFLRGRAEARTDLLDHLPCCWEE
jgi:hypothetical protein